LGLELLKETICILSPNVVIQLRNTLVSHQGPNKMPDLTLEWLLRQPVFAPYRDKIKMNNKRQQDYDGQLSYEYIKIQSAAVSDPIHSHKPKLCGRDHRLLATWSYFFTSPDLSSIHLPWSQLLHVFLLNKTNKYSDVIPNTLEHSIVALCSSEKFDQLQKSAMNVNGTYQLLNYEDELLDCLGFGWIEHCSNETQTYEIFTPVKSLSNINLLACGVFDTPDEFQYMFNREKLK
ncbi:unnamed protein product, partial [Rotaria magnacalcarata]